jgi:hypothetical protein
VSKLHLNGGSGGAISSCSVSNADVDVIAAAAFIGGGAGGGGNSIPDEEAGLGLPLLLPSLLDSLLMSMAASIIVSTLAALDEVNAFCDCC